MILYFENLISEIFEDIYLKDRLLALSDENVCVLNAVEKNILVINGSNYPDVEYGNFILAGHSGTGWKAFFNELYRLQLNDEAYVTYKGRKYTYHLVNIYKQPKIGKVAIYRNHDVRTLTLITCTNYDQTTQTIYILELTSIE